MIGVSCMSGCPVRCKFCATGKLKKWRNLTAVEIIEQVDFVISKNPEYQFIKAKEHKINYTRMGEPFLNIDNLKNAINIIEKKYPKTHHYLSTIGIKDSDFTFIKDNITLQLSVHSLSENKRNWLIPYKNKMTYDDMGVIRTESELKTTINMTLIDESDFNISELQKLFDKNKFFIKLSPINKNDISESNNCGGGYIKGMNLI
jgi:23S rRNA (adenine2503-C2)-methyltransferase